MTPGEREALELLDAVGRHSPDAVLLAEVVSLAARIEPELLRQARIKLLPDVDAGAEADLWFSPLVQSATPVALVLLPEVAALLRRRLAQSGTLLRRSWRLLRRVHEHAPAAIKLEEEVTWQALSGGAGADEWIERELMSVVSAIVNQGRTGLARWALRALPRLPVTARRTKGATMLALASAARLGSWQLLGEQVKGKRLPAGTLSQLRVVLPPDLPQVAVGVRLFQEGGGDGARARKESVVVTGVEFSSPPTAMPITPDWSTDFIEVPATVPLLLEVSWAEGSRRVVKHVSLQQGQTETVEAGGTSITVRTARGDVYTLRRGAQPAGPRGRPSEHVITSTPVPRPPVIGFVRRRDPRGRDIVERLKEELKPGRGRLVALWGAGGIGKTILAAEAVRGLQVAYENRVVWSSADGRLEYSLLSLLDDIAVQLSSANMRTLAPSEREKQVRTLAAGALVVLDNYQTIASAEQKRIEAWLKRTKCSALLTTRAKMRGAVLIPVSAMTHEEAAEFLEKLAAQTREPQLFTPEVRERVQLTAEGNPYVMQWVVAQINLAQEPDEVLVDLRQGRGDAAKRLFDRSFNLPQLGDEGRDVLLALTLFTPSASREALAAVAGLDKDKDLKRLDDAVKNLKALWLIKGVDGDRRLAVEGLTRSLASARRSQDPRNDEFRHRFVTYFLGFANAHKQPAAEDFDALEEEFENVTAAIDLASQTKDWQSVVNICEAVNGFFDTRGYWDECLRRSEQAQRAAVRAKLPEPQPTRFAEIAANIHLRRGEYVRAKRGFNSVLSRYRATNYEPGIAQSLRNLGNIAVEKGNLPEARKFYTQSLEISRRLGDPKNLADNLHNLAVVLQAKGEFKEARHLYEESLVISKKLGDSQSVATTLHQLGVTAAERGDTFEARRLYSESLEINRSLGAQEAVASTLHQWGRLALEEGDARGAESYLQEALGIFEQLGSPAAEEARKDLEGVRAPAPRSRPSKKSSKRVLAKTATKASKALKSPTAKTPTKSNAKKRSTVVKGMSLSQGGGKTGGWGSSKKGGGSKGRAVSGRKRAGESVRSVRSRLRTK